MSLSLNRAFVEARISRPVNPVISRQTCFPNSNIRHSAQLLGLGSIRYPSKKSSTCSKNDFLDSRRIFLEYAAKKRASERNAQGEIP